MKRKAVRPPRVWVMRYTTGGGRSTQSALFCWQHLLRKLENSCGT